MTEEQGAAPPNVFAPGAEPELSRRVHAGLERWARLVSSEDAAARAEFAPLLAEAIVRLPGDPRSSDRAALIAPILRQGIADARLLGDPVAILSGTWLLLQFCEVPLDEGQALIEESLAGVAAAPIGQARTLLIVATEFLFNAAHHVDSLPEREPLLRRSLALLQPLLEGSFEPHLEWQHLALAARLHGELGEVREAAILLNRAVSLVAPGSVEWVKSMIELGLFLNDLQEHEGAAQVLRAVLPFAQAGTQPHGDPGVSLHRGFDLSDVASALAESLSQLQLADEAFEVLGLAFVDDDGHATPCDLRAICAQLAEDELGVLFCVNGLTTMFLFDREEALRVRVIPNASATVWLQTLEATGWLQSAFRSGRLEEIPAAVDHLNTVLGGALSGLQGELAGRYGSLAVIPHRSLCLLPFWLLDACAEVAVRILPTPSLLSNAVPTRPGSVLLSIVDPDGNLPSAHLESEAVRQRLGRAMEFQRLTGEECTVARVLSQLPEAGWVHFAGHAFSDVTDADSSMLQLHRGPDGGDGSLDAGVIRQLDLGGLSLVILSACGSGVAELRVDMVTRLAGLATLLLSQGAGTVVSTVWEIGDDPAALVVDELFAHLLDQRSGMDVPAALKHAVQRVRTMPSQEVAARFERIAAESPNASMTPAALEAADRYRGMATAPFASVDHWGAFFTSGARFIHLDGTVAGG